VNAAVSVAKYFYNTIATKPTPSDMKRTIAQAELLLRDYTVEQIEFAINYTVSHPPKNGFFSIWFLSYVLADLSKKYEAQRIADEQRYKETTMNINTVVEREATKQSDRVHDDFNFDMFGGG